MDTMLLRFNRHILNAMGGLYAFLLGILFLNFTQLPLFANDLLAKIPISTFNITQEINNTLSNEIIESTKDEFDEKTRKKYNTGVISDIQPGIKHIKLTKYYNGHPVKINVVEINKKLANDLEVAPALAAEYLNNKGKISQIAKDANAVVAINGTFFKPQSGVPLGTLMIDNKLYTGPVYDRVAFGIFDNGFDIARVKLDITLKSKTRILKIDNINQPRMLATYILVYTSDWGKVAPPTPKYGLQFAVEKDRITQISSAPLKIPHNGYVIVGPASLLDEFKIGERVNLTYSTTPQWHGVKHIISGGPYLIKDNEVFVDMSEQKLKSIGGKNPRSAIGYTDDNNLVLVVVDGRENDSVGMTLMQLANFMKSIGCVQAMNLDGGGSSVMYINGEIVNNPQAKGGVSISNALVIRRKT